MGGRGAGAGRRRRRRWRRLCPRPAAPGRCLRRRGEPMLCSGSPLRAPAPLRRCLSRAKSGACRGSTSRRRRRRAGRPAGRPSVPSATPTAPSSTTMAAPAGTRRRGGGGGVWPWGSRGWGAMAGGRLCCRGAPPGRGEQPLPPPPGPRGGSRARPGRTLAPRSHRPSRGPSLEEKFPRHFQARFGVPRERPCGQHRLGNGVARGCPGAGDAWRSPSCSQSCPSWEKGGCCPSVVPSAD